MNSKLLGTSTLALAGDLTDRELQAGDQRQNWVKCPFCKQRHVTKWKYVDLDKDSARGLLDPKDYLMGDCARYVCPECGVLWTEQDRWNAVTDGVWAPRDCKVTPEGRITGKVFSNPQKSYYVPSFLIYPGFMTMGKLAKLWAVAQREKKKGDIGPLQNFINSRLTETFTQAEQKTDVDMLRPHIGNYEAGTVPQGVAFLTAAIDVQIDHFWFGVIGWGYLSQAWLIFAARIEGGDTKHIANYNTLREYLSMSFPLVEDPDKTMHIKKIGIDCNYRPHTVIDFCSQCTEVDIVPVRGDPHVKASVSRAKKLEDGKTIRYDLDVDILKSRLHRLLFQAKVPGPGYMHLYKDIPEEYLEQLASEEQRTVRTKRRNETKWVLKNEHQPNHIFDLSGYATFIAELAGLRAIRDPANPRRKIKLSELQKQKRGQ
jgi:phage terminase large subunit GpA-like protein